MNPPVASSAGSPFSWIAGAFSALLLAGTSTLAATGTYNVRDNGAVGDGRTLDTAAINRTITAAAAAGGGTVYFPAGTYLSFSIRLKSNIALYLDQGATLLAAEPSVDLTVGYDAPEPNPGADLLPRTSATRIGTTASSGARIWKTFPSSGPVAFTAKV